MTDERTRQTIAAALERLARTIASPRALTLRPADRAALEGALDRAKAQWLGPSEPVLTVALAGGTGVGKSTLINALAGTRIAEVSEIRPTTRHIQVYHHDQDTVGTLSQELANEAAFVPHNRPELRHKTLVDAPDLDSFVLDHRATTRALLKRSGLVLYVFSPERYLEERTWSVVRKEVEFSASAAVLNKVDRVGSTDELEQITEDLRGRFATLGMGDIRIFRVCARAHVPEPGGNLPDLAPVVDDMVALRAYIERELHSNEIARMLRAQRAQVVTHLRAEVDRIAPESALERLDQVARSAAVRIDETSARLAGALAEPLGIVEAELAPLATLRRHERFWGPFRLWLALGDFIGFGLTNLVRRSLGRPAGERGGLIERTLQRGGTAAIEDSLRDLARTIQDLLYARDLPIERWREITAAVDGPRLIGEVAREVEADFDAIASRASDQGRSVVWAASTLGGLIPSAVVVIGLVVMTRDLFSGTYAGFPLLWHLAAMVVLFFLALQGAVGVLLPGGNQWFGAALGSRAVRRVVDGTARGWVVRYRQELEADIASLREPVAALQAAVATEGPSQPSNGPLV